ncbi:hypothetical protein [Legionella micdadei]|uniref:hypothetical protein n=1 Tax=Legionella micdadei TaxID=451 RepID=UPI003A7FF4DA
MAKKKIIRIAERIQITEALIESLKNIFGDNIAVERCSDEPNLQQIYRRRADILADAFKFILDTVPLKPGSDDQQLRKYLTWCKTQCAFPAKEPIEAYQKMLSQYTAQLIGGLLDHCDLGDEVTDEAVATELLNKAEQYVIMQKGGHDLATLMQMNIYNPNDFVLLWDEQLPPCSEETLAELETINASSVQTTPDWFRRLPSDQQLYFHSIDNQDVAVGLKFQLNKFKLTAWPAIKALYEAKRQHSVVFQQSLQAIKEDKNLPSWYTSLALEQQRFVKEMVSAVDLRELASTKTLQQDLAAIANGHNLPAWYHLLPPDQQKLLNSLASPQGVPSAFETRVNELEKTLIKIGSAGLEHFTSDIEGLRKLPYWFLTLEGYEQRFLKESLRRATTKPKGRVVDAVAFIPSRLCTIPGVRNFRRFRSFILDADGKILEEHEPRYCSSHLVPRDELKKPRQVLDVHTHRNMETILKYGDMFLFQTLISPEFFVAPDYELEQERQRVVAWVAETKKVTIYPTNHPYNCAKYIDYTSSSNPECLAIWRLAESFALLDGLPELENPQDWDVPKIEKLMEEAFTESQHVVSADETQIKGKLIAFFHANAEQLRRWPNWRQACINHLYMTSRKETNEKEYFAYRENLADVAHLAADYKALLNSGYGTATFLDYNGRELFLSTYEHLLSIKTGVKSYGSCVSGKDRKWIEICHTLAAILYRSTYGKWPSYFDKGKDRENFVKIAAEIFVWGHGYAGADKSANGCPGTKTPESYWPADIAEEIKKRLKDPRALEISDILASNNEVSAIVNEAYLLKPGFSNFIMQVLKLSDESQLALLSRLNAILQEKKFWQHNLPYWKSFFKSGPEGIGQIQTHIAPRSDSENAKRALILAEIFSDITKRPKVSDSRSLATQTVYDCIWKLNEAIDPEALMEETLKTLDRIKIEAYEFNANNIKISIS